MRHSLQRIVHLSSQGSKECIRCQVPLRGYGRWRVVGRTYATIKDEGVASTSTVPEDPDLITTESPSLQSPPPSPLPPTPPPQSCSPRIKEPWHFRLPPQKMDSKTRQNELKQAITETSLRKRLHWFPPLHGVNPAYDMAVLYLEQDRNEKIQIISRLEQRIAQEKENNGDVRYISELENARYRMLVLRDINSPKIRWQFKQGDIDLRIPAHQYMYSRSWSDGVYVRKILQRLHTMKIIPDSLPTLTPKVEFRLRFNEQKVPSRIRMRGAGWRDTDPGEKLPSKILMNPPRMEIIPHHREWWESRKYTVVMLDLDVENDSFTTKLHWMVKDIVASPIKTIIKEGNGETVIPYVPPHPYRGMKYHRYPLFVFEQPSDEWLASRTQVFTQRKEQRQSSLENISPLPTPSTTTGLRTYATDAGFVKSKYAWQNLERNTFNIRAWANQMGMKPVGAHLVRCEWDENVPVILESLGIPERAFKRIKSQETSPFDHR